MNDKKKLYQLIERIANHMATDEEIRQYNAWCNSCQDKGKAIPDFDTLKARMLEDINEEIDKRKLYKLFNSPFYRFAAAAVVLITLSVGIYFYQALSSEDTFHKTELVDNDIAPGGNRATLTLADGSIVNLSDAQSGIVIDSDHIKYDDGTSIGSSSTFPSSDESLPSVLALTTPKGGQYQITLPDGTKAWLNAESSIKYPSRFINNERRVEVSGEVYFEVSKNAKMPFIVISAGQKVEVLGTHFNINSYEGEGAVKTTLLEGSVRVSKNHSTSHVISTEVEQSVRSSPLISVILSPDQQSTIAPEIDNIIVDTVDPESVIAWKNGDFVFKDEALGSIMRKISRWYNVEIVYEKDAPMDISLGGLVSKYQNVSDVLKVMELTGKVHFKIEGRRIIVMK